mmetsp:Transcript_10057/g.16944  ORF Transcript_10057/g.16944 Transcript_10057/m.16944 type:complete len:408 (-) Transcript_10057:30-1253(-)
MVQSISIEEELLKSGDEQLYKLLNFTLMILVQALGLKGSGANDIGSSRAGEGPTQRVIFVIKISPNLDPALKRFLGSVKTTLLIKSVTMRLVIIEGDKVIAGQGEKGEKVDWPLGQHLKKITDLAHFLIPNQLDEQERYLMNGTVLLLNRQALSLEVVQNVREKNLFTFGSTRQRLNAFANFLKGFRDDNQLQELPHVPPSILSVYAFMKRHQDKQVGFRYVVNEILHKQVFAAENPKLSALLLHDFEEYVDCVQHAQNLFFSDGLARSPSMQSLFQKGLSELKAKDTSDIVTTGHSQLKLKQNVLRARDQSADNKANPRQELEQTTAPPSKLAPQHSKNAAPQQNNFLWTQMSINCLMNSSQFSSDLMTQNLNERAFGLEEASIVKVISGSIGPEENATPFSIKKP